MYFASQPWFWRSQASHFRPYMEQISVLIVGFVIVAIISVLSLMGRDYFIKKQAIYIITKNTGYKPLSIGMVLEPDQQKLTGVQLIGVLFINGNSLILEYIEKGVRYGGRVQSIQAKVVGSPVYKDMAYYIPIRIDQKLVLFAPIENKFFYSQRRLAKATVKNLIVELSRNQGHG